MVEHLSILIFCSLEILERGVADAEEQHEDNGDRGGPSRYGFCYPQQHGHDEDSDDTLLHDGQAVNAEETTWKIPYDYSQDCCNHKHQEFPFAEISR